MTQLTYEELAAHRGLFSTPEWNLAVYLLEHPGWNRVKNVAGSIAIGERALRRSGGTLGVRASTSRKLFESVKHSIIARTSHPSGFKLTNDPIELEEAAELIEDHLWSEKSDADEWRSSARALQSTQPAPQLEMSFQ